MADIEYLDSTMDEDPDLVIVDAEVAGPHAAACDACGSPVESHDRFCPACGAPAAGAEAPAEQQQEAEHRYFRCQNCGSEVAADLEQRSYVCTFCDSTYVVEFSRDVSGRQRPEFVIGFSVTPDEAREKFNQWISENTWYRPGDLKAESAADKQRGVYLPFWSFSMLANSGWSANIGEYWYRTETYTTTDSKGRRVTRTRRVRETEWWPLSGRHHRYYSGYLVSGSRGLPQSDAERIKPFQLPALKRYEPYYLAGWLSEEYSIEREEALKTCQRVFYQREQRNVAAFLPGDTHRALNVQTHFSGVNSDLCLLPVYVLSYRYRDKLFRFLVNGQTGKVAGDKPVSWRRIGIVSGIAVGLILLVIAVIWLISAMS